MGNAPAFQIPHPVIFESQFNPTLVSDTIDGNGCCRYTVGRETGTLT